MEGGALRVLTLCYEYRPIGGGGAKVAENLIEQMLEAGYEIDLVTMGFRDLPRFEQQGQLTIHRVPCGRRSVSICHPHEMFVYLLRALPLVARLMREGRYDLVHTHFIFPDGILAALTARRNGLKFIITAHGSDVPDHNPDRFQLLHILLRPIWKAIVRRAECIVCPSEYLRGLLLKSAPDARSIVIPNGIDTDRYKPAEQRARRILVVSRMVESKGVQFLIRALHDLDHDYEVCVVGDGPYLPRLKALAGELDVKVEFTGFIDNTSARFREILESSEIFAFTSSAENFPVVLLEAMSAGLCIITTDDTGCREVVGDAAVKVPPKNAEAIRRALLALMADPARRGSLGRDARARVLEHFTEGKVVEQYRQLYQRTAGHA
jgi:glycosyltransferase involved in cell wall biosynthesis